jgi:UMF1 family MFS transporter
MISLVFANLVKAFFFLAALIAAPFPILMAVNTERGKRDGMALAVELAAADEGQDADAARLLGGGYNDNGRA